MGVCEGVWVQVIRGLTGDRVRQLGRTSSRQVMSKSELLTTRSIASNHIRKLCIHSNLYFNSKLVKENENFYAKRVRENKRRVAWLIFRINCNSYLFDVCVFFYLFLTLWWFYLKKNIFKYKHKIR